MLTKETFTTILSMYEKYQNDITLFTLEDIKILINYYTEHPLFSEIKTSKGYSIIQKIIYKLVIKEYNKDEEVFKYDEMNQKYNIFLYGDIKKRNYFKGMKRLGKSKYLYCIYKCLSKSYFAEIDYDIYKKYILVDQIVLLNKFIDKINKFSFFKNLTEISYKNLFLRYERKIYNKNEVIYKEGDEIDGIYLIIKGECAIVKQKVKLTQEDKLQKLSNEVNTLMKEGEFLQKRAISYNIFDPSNVKNKLKYNKKKIKLVPIFANNNNKNNILLTISPGDIFGDLEISKKYNKRQFSVVSSSHMKTKVWFFPLNIIRHFFNNIHILSTQKYEIIKNRLKYTNFIDKIKKQNLLSRNDKKIDDLINMENNHTFNEKIYNTAVLSINNLKNFFNNKIIKEEENKNNNNNIFLTSTVNNICKNTSRKNSCIHTERLLRYVKDQKIKVVHSKSTFNFSNYINDKINNNYNQKIYNYKEINLFRNKKNYCSKFKKRNNKIQSRNINLNPINLYSLTNRITNYCGKNETTNDINNILKYNNKSIASSSNNDTCISYNNKNLNSFDSHEN